MEGLAQRLLQLKPMNLPVEAAARQLQSPPDAVRRAAEQLVECGWLSRHTSTLAQYEYTPEGRQAQAEGLPEMQLLQKAIGQSIPLSALSPPLSRFGLPSAKKSGWVSIANGQLSLTDAGRAALEENALFSLPSDAHALSDFGAERLGELARRNLVRERLQSQTLLSITGAGAEALASFPSTESASGVSLVDGTGGAPPSAPPASGPAISTIERNMLLSGSWKGRPLRRYDLSAPVPSRPPARRHPISRLRERIRSIFLSLGFEEMEGPMAESAFWNFDALFQPQDHPARDLADTFYLPGPAGLPARALVERVREAHEAGWKYGWAEEKARGRCLRTHTTAVSARTLHATADDPRARKFFSVGKVFRNEATDYKHLAEFYQVEGIVACDGATLGQLLGTLQAFYAKLGFSKVRFRPSYFPYTEPSLEVEVWHPAREAWLELGGAGIFRPEVSLPLCNKYPVLAWGLSLERPLMLAHRMEDIRTLYRNDLGWLRNFQVE